MKVVYHELIFYSRDLLWTCDCFGLLWTWSAL